MGTSDLPTHRQHLGPTLDQAVLPDREPPVCVFHVRLYFVGIGTLNTALVEGFMARYLRYRNGEDRAHLHVDDNDEQKTKAKQDCKTPGSCRAKERVSRLIVDKDAGLVIRAPLFLSDRGNAIHLEKKYDSEGEGDKLLRICSHLEDEQVAGTQPAAEGGEVDTTRCGRGVLPGLASVFSTISEHAIRATHDEEQDNTTKTTSTRGHGSTPAPCTGGDVESLFSHAKVHPEVGQRMERQVLFFAVRPPQVDEALAQFFTEKRNGLSSADVPLVFVNLVATLTNEELRDKMALYWKLAKPSNPEKYPSTSLGMMTGKICIVKAVPLPPARYLQGCTVVCREATTFCLDASANIEQQEQNDNATCGPTDGDTEMVKLVEKLFGLLGTVTMCENTVDLPVFQTMTGLMGQFYQQMDWLSDWMVEHSACRGADEVTTGTTITQEEGKLSCSSRITKANATEYVASFYKSILADVIEKLPAREEVSDQVEPAKASQHVLKHLMDEQTRGGMTVNNPQKVVIDRVDGDGDARYFVAEMVCCMLTKVWRPRYRLVHEHTDTNTIMRTCTIHIFFHPHALCNLRARFLMETRSQRTGDATHDGDKTANGRHMRSTAEQIAWHQNMTLDGQKHDNHTQKNSTNRKTENYSR
ncbi:unnamed protein product [Amoebophrya sp. A120]|nr:unnamed protein product [Amoebophrya sp. A120]|eukprot:GSA120T00021368001.1